MHILAIFELTSTLPNLIFGLFSVARKPILNGRAIRPICLLFLNSWQTIWCHDMFLTSLWTCWHIFSIMTNFRTMTNVLTSWWTFWRHDELFDYFLHHDELLRHDEFFDMTNFLTWRVFNVITYIWRHDVFLTYIKYITCIIILLNSSLNYINVNSQ